jgi:hypothetical protein
MVAADREDFSRPMVVDVSANGDKILIITSVFYTPLDRFRGVAVPAARVNRVAVAGMDAWNKTRLAGRSAARARV